MKKARLLVMVLVIVIGIGSWAGAALADWYTCTVAAAGPANSSVFVQLTDTAGSFQNRWFRAYSLAQKEILATALTANVNGQKVLVNLSSSAEGSTISVMYLEN